MGGIEFIEKGGIVMYPILGCSIVALGIAIERLIAYAKLKKETKKIITKVPMLVRNEKFTEAIAECDTVKAPIGAIFKSALINRNKEISQIKVIMDEVGAVEVTHIEKYLVGLSTITTITPLLGLLGTVTGMVSSFNAISAATGIGETPLLAAGIAEALLTTVFGLSVAIPSLVFYNYFSKQVDSIVSMIEKGSIELLNILIDLSLQKS